MIIYHFILLTTLIMAGRRVHLLNFPPVCLPSKTESEDLVGTFGHVSGKLVHRWHHLCGIIYVGCTK